MCYLRPDDPRIAWFGATLVGDSARGPTALLGKLSFDVGRAETHRELTGEITEQMLREALKCYVNVGTGTFLNIRQRQCE